MSKPTQPVRISLRKAMTVPPAKAFVLATTVFIAGATCGAVHVPSEPGFGKDSLSPRPTDRAASRRRAVATASLLKLIRDQLKPSTTMLSKVFGVSRQTIYNWYSDENPRSEAAEKIKSLAEASGVLFERFGATAARVCRMPVDKGKSFWDLVGDGAEPSVAAEKVVQYSETYFGTRRPIAAAHRGDSYGIDSAGSFAPHIPSQES